MADLAGSYVAVVGPASTATPEDLAAAGEIAEALAGEGATIITGGMNGVMQAAAQGAARGGGVSVGILPGIDRSRGSSEHTVLLATGLGELRNGLVVRVADLVIAVGGSWGTLSEVALAVRTETPLIMVGGWPLPAAGGLVARDAAEALEMARRILGKQ